jgi:hypothetical protein
VKIGDLDLGARCAIADRDAVPSVQVMVFVPLRLSFTVQEVPLVPLAPPAPSEMVAVVPSVQLMVDAVAVGGDGAGRPAITLVTLLALTASQGEHTGEYQRAGASQARAHIVLRDFEIEANARRPRPHPRRHPMNEGQQSWDRWWSRNASLVNRRALGSLQAR